MFKKQKAFTLIELLITLIIIGIVLGLATPSFTKLIINNSSLALGGDLVAAINFARQEAVKRGRRVSLCPSNNGLTCLTSDDWAKGWLVFEDKATSDGATPDVNTPIRQWADLNSKAVVTATGSAAIAYVRFTGSGMLARLNATDVSPRVFQVSITGCTGQSKSTVTVGLAGMNSLTKTACP
ncbi:MAG: prepilin-type N-terminal cleavage/methylation domain-containing protein [Gammaproteobacteria bacterium]|nr:MAG: prepilin-type N-terminal cleavage/methylation domain-containing protein [Gammaproteobacteria bacterium]